MGRLIYKEMMMSLKDLGGFEDVFIEKQCPKCAIGEMTPSFKKRGNQKQMNFLVII